LPTVVDASQSGRVAVVNDCAPLSPADLDRIKQRFNRRGALSDGYGLGLSIIQDLCAQSGCQLEIYVPRELSPRGFAAVLRLPETTNGPS